MKGYKTTICVTCGKIHDNAANCPSHQAMCTSCQESCKKKEKSEK